MSITFKNILSNLVEYKMTMIKNPNFDIPYKEVRFIYGKEMNIDGNTLYIGKTSMLPNNIYEYNDIGLILIDDCSFDFSSLNLSVAVLHEDTNILKVFDYIQNILNSKRKLMESSAVLLNSLIKGKGLKYIVQIGSEILGNPILIMDASFKLLASSTTQGVDDPLWMDVITLGYTSQKFVTLLKKENYPEKLYNSTLPIIVTLDSSKNLKRIMGKITIKDKIVGYIGVLEIHKKFKDEDIEIVSILSDVISSEMQKNKLYSNPIGLAHEYLLLDLLDEKIKNPQVMEERLKSFHWDLNNDFYVTTIDVSKDVESFHHIEYLRAYFERCILNCKSVYYNDNIILLFNCKNFKDVQYTKSKLIEILSSNNINAGMSQKFSNIMEIKKYYSQSKNALTLGNFLKKENYLFEYENLYIYDLLALVDKNSNIKDFCHPGIYRVLEYDKSNGTDYYTTLYEYLINGTNKSITAQKLYIHRNTIVHRINKISEITSLNLENGDDCLKLLLSYKIREFLKE